MDELDQLVEACDQGAENACDALTREQEAKAAWLAKQDLPGASVRSEAAAKAAWLAKQALTLTQPSP